MRTTRRRLLLGGAALAASTRTAAGREQHDDQELAAMGEQLERLRRRVRRLQRRVRPGDDQVSWARWSRSVAECEAIAEKIIAMKANGLRGVAIKYRALIWLLVDDDVLVDVHQSDGPVQASFNSRGVSLQQRRTFSAAVSQGDSNANT
jgi:hypothetical protein